MGPWEWGVWKPEETRGGKRTRASAEEEARKAIQLVQDGRDRKWIMEHHPLLYQRFNQLIEGYLKETARSIAEDTDGYRAAPKLIVFKGEPGTGKSETLKNVLCAAGMGKQ